MRLRGLRAYMIASCAAASFSHSAKAASQSAVSTNRVRVWILPAESVTVRRTR